MKAFKMIVNGHEVSFGAICLQAAETLASAAGADLSSYRGVYHIKVVEDPTRGAYETDLKNLVRQVKLAQGGEKALREHDFLVRIQAKF